MKRRLLIRWICFVGGIVILTFGARIILLSSLGVGGLDAIAIGLSAWVGSSIGVWIILLGITLVVIAAFIRRRFTIAPLGTSLLVGWFYDLWGDILFNHIVAPTETAYIGYTFLLGILVAPLGAALYISSEISMGPVDYLMIAVKERFHKSMQVGRTFIEVIFVAVGYFVGGPIGIGTICIMLFWGPILQVYYTVVQKLLGKYMRKK
ncbi:MAG: hypothetical protein E7231_18130 [Cellulosilyticum sp.]|nr:hypothetical protein [Cellulosilyticum sp.]